jgi:hypothetical protein
VELIGNAGLIIAYGVNSFANVMMNSMFFRFVCDGLEGHYYGPDANWR